MAITRKEWNRRQRKYKKTYKSRNRRFVRAYKEFMGCQRCSEKRPVCLHFHHTKPLTRRKLLAKGKTRSQIMLRNVPHLAGVGSSLKAIVREIEKCELICANCHMVETYDNSGEYRT